MMIGRVYDIIMELNNTLDHKVGGEISKNLEQLYLFIMEKLTRANITGDPEHLRVCLKIIENLHEGWKGAVEKIKKDEVQNK